MMPYPATRNARLYAMALVLIGTSSLNKDAAVELLLRLITLRTVNPQLERDILQELILGVTGLPAAWHRLGRLVMMADMIYDLQLTEQLMRLADNGT